RPPSWRPGPVRARTLPHTLTHTRRLAWKRTGGVLEVAVTTVPPPATHLGGSPQPWRRMTKSVSEVQHTPQAPTRCRVPVGPCSTLPRGSGEDGPTLRCTAHRGW